MNIYKLVGHTCHVKLISTAQTSQRKRQLGFEALLALPRTESGARPKARYGWTTSLARRGGLPARRRVASDSSWALSSPSPSPSHSFSRSIRTLLPSAAVMDCAVGWAPGVGRGGGVLERFRDSYFIWLITCTVSVSLSVESCNFHFLFRFCFW